MPKIVSLINMKGGVGKSTLTVNLAWHFAAYRHWLKRVLVVDLDPQFNASQYLLGVNEYQKHLESGNPVVGVRSLETPDEAIRGAAPDKLVREESSVRASRNYLSALNALARMDYSNAAALMKEAVELDPKAKYFKTLAGIQAKNPNWRQRAIATYRQALKLEPDEAGSYLGLAQVLEAEGQIDEAQHVYRRCLELLPDNPTAKAGLQRLGGVPVPAGRSSSTTSRKE